MGADEAQVPSSADDEWHFAEAILQRGADSSELARAAFRRAYPDAPEEMIAAAAFHVFTDGIDAAREWLADAERFLRDPSRRLCFGATWHLIYHLYNWLQLQSLMPQARAGVLEFLDEIAENAEKGDIEAIKKTVQDLKDLVRGHGDPPAFH